MAKKNLNSRCPLQAECERKCEYERHELDCEYYANNGVGEDRTIPDQEEKRRDIERRRNEDDFLAHLGDDDEDDGKENNCSCQGCRNPDCVCAGGDDAEARVTCDGLRNCAQTGCTYALKHRQEQSDDHVADIGKMVYLPIEQLFPHPDNPRKDLGDLDELAESIKVNGVLQNLTVVPNMVAGEISGQVWQRGYKVIIGHRRLAASKKAGLKKLPCIITQMTEREQLSTMLMENMQRSDLTVYEQAQGFQMMLDMGDTIEQIAEKSGFSTTTVRRRVKMMELDQKTLKEVSSRQLSLADFDQLAQVEDIEARNKCLEKIGTSDFSQSVATQLRRQAVKKNLPAVKKILKDCKAKAIKQNETWGGKYDSLGYIQISDWNQETPLIPEDAPDKLFYNLDEQYGSLRFYKEHKRAAPAKKSAAELARQKQLNAVWERANELRAVTYKLRADFVNGLSLNSKNSTLMIKGALVSIIFRCVDYASADRELIVKTLGIDDSSYSSKRAEDAMAAFEGTSAKGYPTLIYANFGDGEKLSHVAGHSGEWPKYSQDARLVALYEWLCSLGYEMSDDEKALQDGTHELFKER